MAIGVRSSDCLQKFTHVLVTAMPANWCYCPVFAQGRVTHIMVCIRAYPLPVRKQVFVLVPPEFLLVSLKESVAARIRPKIASDAFCDYSTSIWSVGLPTISQCVSRYCRMYGDVIEMVLPGRGQLHYLSACCTYYRVCLRGRYVRVQLSLEALSNGHSLGRTLRGGQLNRAKGILLEKRAK